MSRDRCPFCHLTGGFHDQAEHRICRQWAIMVRIFRDSGQQRWLDDLYIAVGNYVKRYRRPV